MLLLRQPAILLYYCNSPGFACDSCVDTRLAASVFFPTTSPHAIVWRLTLTLTIKLALQQGVVRLCPGRVGVLQTFRKRLLYGDSPFSFVATAAVMRGTTVAIQISSTTAGLRRGCLS